MTFLSRLMDAEWLTSVQDLITSTSSEQGQKLSINQTNQNSIAESDPAALNHIKRIQSSD
jgi:hypothetical protein